MAEDKTDKKPPRANRLGVGMDDKHVLMVFTTDGDYVALSPIEARNVAKSLMEKADVLDGGENKVVTLDQVRREKGKG
jgi:hypothetical protein